MIYVFTGNGKGKSTAAIGMGIRAVGAGRKVLMIQFLKTRELTSENKAIEKVEGFNIRSFGRKGFFLPKSELEKRPKLKKQGIKPFSQIDFKLAKEGFDLAKEVGQSKRCGLLILDEINLATHFGLIDRKEVLDFLKKYGEKLDMVLTGRHCPKEIVKIADLVTEMKEVRHYYRRGVKAKKGIEY
ncbi:cob(I)yrinic acid a,c-diamide adenosyltransferase [Patescibacteria group bacterium]|nr:cob(I)yrinic acid a,c-diamide adenosyltransferase [Patescibacteria group bacterium]MBU1563605.1 cob(I)yrinic acid a,c-diamide adenosyltransferase [Patescibacteria group bacterium]